MRKRSLWTSPEFLEKQKKRILSYLRKRNRPALLGEVSLWISMRLDETKNLLEELVEENKVKPLPEEQCDPMRSLHYGYVFVLVDPDSIPRGDYE